VEAFHRRARSCIKQVKPSFTTGGGERFSIGTESHRTGDETGDRQHWPRAPRNRPEIDRVDRAMDCDQTSVGTDRYMLNHPSADAGSGHRWGVEFRMHHYLPAVANADQAFVLGEEKIPAEVIDAPEFSESLARGHRPDDGRKEILGKQHRSAWAESDIARGGVGVWRRWLSPLIWAERDLRHCCRGGGAIGERKRKDFPAVGHIPDANDPVGSPDGEQFAIV